MPKPLEILKTNMLAHKSELGPQMTEENWKEHSIRPEAKEMLTVFEKSMNEFARQEQLAFMDWFLKNQGRYANPNTDFLYSEFKK